jgi:serine/threonine-protein kinase
VDVNKGDTVNLVVSTGAPKVTVPSVVGDSLDDAKSELEGDDYQFVVKTETRESTEDPDTVLEQDPRLGTEVEKGTTITLTIAIEKKQSTVPDVLNKSCDEAKAQMTANNLVGNCTEVETDDANQVGKVIQTSPQSGQQADPGSSVQIQIGKAKAQVNVPNINGQTLGAAKALLQQAGLQVGNITGSQDDNAVVLGSDPGQGNPVDPGTTVNLITADQPGNNGGDNGDNGLFGGSTG